MFLRKSASRRDGAVMHSKRRRKIQRSLQSPVLVPAASPVANRVLLERALALQQHRVFRDHYLETGCFLSPATGILGDLLFDDEGAR